MKVLITEDDPTSRLVLERSLGSWGYEVISCQNGREALRALDVPEPPKLAILDWMMPEIDGLEVCRTIRRTPRLGATYVILLTSRGTKEDLVEGFRAGADDYVIKPFHRDELRARLGAGIRIVELEQSLNQRVRDVESAMAQLTELRGLLPACASCGAAREGVDYRARVEAYLAAHPEAMFSHWVCPQCAPRSAREAPEGGTRAAISRASLEEARSARGSFRGELAALGVSEVIQTVHRGMKTGRLRISRRDGGEGDVFFVDGGVCHARTPDRTGEAAFNEILAWREGAFLFEPEHRTEQTSIFRPAMGLLVEGLRRLDDGESPED